MNRILFTVIFGVLCALLAGQSANAVPIIAFEWTEGAPGTNSIHQSRHGLGGPVLADDFVSAFTGTYAPFRRD